jgi:uncharacterized spore protein YtfJ
MKNKGFEIGYQTKTMIGEELKIGRRILYPVVLVFNLTGGEKRGLFGAMVTPWALLVVEAKDAYAISLTGQEISLQQLLDLVPTLKEKIAKPRTIVQKKTRQKRSKRIFRQR